MVHSNADVCNASELCIHKRVKMLCKQSDYEANRTQAHSRGKYTVTMEPLKDN
jgi:hypothetical protein